MSPALGGPWVTVRAHYGALPSMAGRVPAKGGETCLDGEFARAGARKNRSQGRRSRRGGAPGGVAVCLCFPAIREISRGVLQCAFRRSASPHSWGGKLKAQLARRRENADPWLFEMRI